MGNREMGEPVEYESMSDDLLLWLADQLASELRHADRVAEVALPAMKLEGLLHLAQIRALDARGQLDHENTATFARETAAVENLAAKLPVPVEAGVCGDRAPVVIRGSNPVSTCQMQHGHTDMHRDGDARWTGPDPAAASSLLQALRELERKWSAVAHEIEQAFPKGMVDPLERATLLAHREHAAALTELLEKWGSRG